MRLWNRLRHWADGPRVECDLADEMRLHREMLEQQFAAQGMSREDARAAAARIY